MRFSKVKVLKRVFTFVMCLVMAVASICVFTPETYNVNALTSSEIQQKIEECERREKEIQAKIDALQGDLDAAHEKAKKLEEQVKVIENKISLINQKISTLQKEIDEKNQKIAQKEGEIKDAKELLKKRLRAICVAGASTDLLILLSAQDYGDFLQKADVMKCITTDTKELMLSLEEEIKEINKEKKEVEAKKAEADALKQQLVTEQKALDAKYTEAANAYSAIKGTEEELEAESAEIEAEKDKLQAEFDRIAKEAAQNSSVGNVTIDGGSYGFAWPYGGSCYISSGYGYRIHPTLGYSKLHGGIDITGSGAYGKPIYSIAAGKVILSQYYDSYGNCIMIDHGKYNGTSIVSLYAHCASLSVSVGQSVSKGQYIGAVGSTGRSTGPHLHFEIRANGERVNPLNYYSNY